MNFKEYINENEAEHKRTMEFMQRVKKLKDKEKDKKTIEKFKRLQEKDRQNEMNEK
jgi:hypothetical protein